jgi:hypothetical protein
MDFVALRAGRGWGSLRVPNLRLVAVAVDINLCDRSVHIDVHKQYVLCTLYIEIELNTTATTIHYIIKP